MSGRPSYRELKEQLRHKLPAYAFRPLPSRGFLALAMVSVEACIMAGIIIYSPPWPIAVLGSFAISQLIVGSGFIAHETLHGATFRSRWAQNLLSWFTFGQFLIPPDLWRAWHVQVHHGRANIPGEDPDSLGWVDTIPDRPIERIYYAVVPGSGSKLGYFTPLFLFSMQIQMILWYYSSGTPFRKTPMGTSLGRIRVRAQSMLLLATLIGFGIWMGWPAAFFVLILPHMFANITFMAYIGPNHWLDRVHSSENDPMQNTSSIRLWKPIDWLHGWFSYHQEHHIFPMMSPYYAPEVHRLMNEIDPALPSRVPLLKTIRWIYRTPRAYDRSGTHLVSVDGTWSVPIELIKRDLLPDRRDSQAS